MTAFAAAPLPLSSVTLAGEFAAMQAANREVLLSLNMSRWACHFTTTANLTSCRSAAVPWHTYLKNATVPFGFVHEDGFLGAGDDLAPPSDLLFPDCAARCAGARACVGFCFEAPSEEPAEKVKCYLKTAAHFTPQRRKANCLTNGPLSPRASHRSAPLLDPPSLLRIPAAGSATAPPCEPLPGEMGLGGYYGHYQGHWLSATAYLINATGGPPGGRAEPTAGRRLLTPAAASRRPGGHGGGGGGGADSLRRDGGVGGEVQGAGLPVSIRPTGAGQAAGGARRGKLLGSPLRPLVGVGQAAGGSRRGPVLLGALLHAAQAHGGASRAAEARRLRAGG